ncbi:NAD(P)-dependent oxidoreductase [Rhodococcus olei]|uniref:NAD(P)-dependent oxidoreductase n=1 Tax=Rhodococcus olei TaxID=2161675 RepID=A0ABP8PL51_9NOCA
MDIFVAGGSGVLGRAVVQSLIAAGSRVTAMTRSPGKAAVLRSLGAEPVVADAFDQSAVTRAVAAAGPDAVVHLLTDLGSGDSSSNARLRTVGTRNLVDAATRAGVTRMVAESISWIYPPDVRTAEESTPLDLDAAEPRRTTIMGVDALENAVRELPHGTVLRFGQFYGPGTWYSRDGRHGDAARSGTLAATETVTSFVHVHDAAQAAVAALAWPSGTWNIVDDDPAAGREWAPRLADLLGGPEPVFSVCGDIGRPVSNSRARDHGLVLRHPSWREGFATL